MSFFEAILLGIIQGITEFFPISSSGHLVIAEQLLGIETDYGILFHVILHIGTLVAVLLNFRKDIIRLLYSFAGIFHDIWKNFRIFLGNLIKRQENKYHKVLRTQYRKLAVLILAANIPTAFVGLAMRNLIANAASSLLITGSGLLVTGLLLFVVGFSEHGNKKPKNTSWYSAFIIGACQGFSVVPGISRFGITMTAGLLNGYSKLFALKYSFLISVPTIIGAIIFELVKLPEQSGLTFGFVICCIFGAVAAAVTGFFVIKAMVRIIKKGKLRVFAYYCLGAGLFVILMNYLI